MSRLGEFLQAKQPLFDTALKQLEDRSGRKGVDVALTAEVATKSAEFIKRLKLDPECTGPELYQALIDQVAKHDHQLAEAIGGSDPADVAQMIPLILKHVQQVDMPRSGCFLKVKVAEALLKKMPPKEVIKHLGYKNLAEMLRNENVFEIYGALRFAETADWLNEFNAQYAQLKHSDFEPRDIQIIRFDAKKWGGITEHFVAKKLHNITNLKELGAICILPIKIKHMPGVTLKIMPLIFHYFNEIRLYSSFFKLIKNKQNFGEIVATTLIADTPNIPITQGQNIHWRVIQRYFGKLKNEPHPEIFEPHVQPEDLHWRKAEELLYEVDPYLTAWRDMDYVAVMKPDGPVTFNLMDISLSYSNGLKYQDRYLYHFRESLWNEIFARYMGQKVLEEQLLVKLNNDLIAPEKL
ncbi:MAG TPA: hypothetical protein VNA68_02870 [Candidatus Dormibacteraeota bacterium]|nr:hypothetical protein [Candidatus Dormibacteraeota bacterium]